MSNLYVMVVIITATFSVVLFLIFIWSLFKNESVKKLSFELAGCIVFTLILICSVIPGAESNFEMGNVKYKFKTPSKIAQLAGTHEKTFEAQNTNNNNSKTIIFSATSTAPTVGPDLNFLVGKEYIKNIKESKDGKERIFSATLPPGKEIKTASPEQVIINVLPNSFLWNLGKLLSPDEEAKALKEYYKLKNPK